MQALRTLLLGSPDHSWNEWIRAHRGPRDLLVLDPRHSASGPPGRAIVLKGERVASWHFLGSLDAQRNPIEVFAAAVALRQQLNEPWIALLFPHQGSAVRRQLALAIAQFLGPEEVLTPEGSEAGSGWPVGPHETTVGAAFPSMVLAAQRQAAWMELLGESKPFAFDLDRVALSGARLGSGTRLRPESFGWTKPPMWAERSGGHLLAIADQTPSDAELTQALNITGCSRASLASPEDLRGLVCSLAKDDGRELALGVIEGLDPARGQLIVSNPLPSPESARLLKLGAIRVSPDGKERPELKPWAL